MATIEISCVEIWREISNYLAGEISAELRDRMQAHFEVCKHCSAVLDGTRNVVELVEECFPCPKGSADACIGRLGCCSIALHRLSCFRLEGIGNIQVVHVHPQLPFIFVISPPDIHVAIPATHRLTAPFGRQR